MKAIVITLYVACVLLFSGFARAESLFSANGEMMSPVAIDHVEIKHAEFALEIFGLLPSPCYKQPTATLVPDAENPNVLILRLSSPYPTMACIAPTARYETLVSLPALAQSSQIPLHNKAKYLIKTEGFAFEVEVLGSDLMK